MRYLSRWAGLILLAALAGLVLACGNAPAETSVENTAVSAPIELMKKALAKGEELKSFRARLDMKVKAQGDEVPMSIDLEQSEDKRIRMVMDMQSPVGGMKIEMIMAEGSIFTKLPGAGGWVKMKADALAAITGQPLEALNDPGGFYKNLFPSEDVPWELYAVESLGSELVEGVETEHLGIQMDFAKIMNQMDSETKELMSQNLALGGLNVDDVLDQVDVTRLEVWIDPTGHTRKIVMEMTMGGDSAMAMDMRMFDFDQPISIEIPTNVSEFTFP